jgi:CHAD domain-containing protein
MTWVRLGSDLEDVHRFRVATRRTRAGDRLDPAAAAADEFAPLAGELSWPRTCSAPCDLDVLIDHLELEVAQLDVDEAGGRDLVAALAVERESSDALSCSRQWTRRAISTCSPRSPRRST